MLVGEYGPHFPVGLVDRSPIGSAHPMLGIRGADSQTHRHFIWLLASEGGQEPLLGLYYRSVYDDVWGDCPHYERKLPPGNLHKGLEETPHTRIVIDKLLGMPLYTQSEAMAGVLNPLDQAVW
jgi:hypothetical protein